jgi:hypothetical protein
MDAWRGGGEDVGVGVLPEIRIRMNPKSGSETKDGSLSGSLFKDKALKTQNGAIKGRDTHTGGSKWSRGGFLDQWVVAESCHIGEVQDSDPDPN